VRIIGGGARGLRIAGPGRISGIRPTPDRVREALFNMIDVSGGFFLDLFAGTGAVGCEAASRGAVHVTMVEKNRQAAAIARKNTAAVKSALGGGPDMRLVNSDVMKFLANAEGRVEYGWVFADPPYRWENTGLLVEMIFKSKALSVCGTVIVEAPSRALPETDMKPARVKRYGDTSLLFFEQQR